MYYIVLYITSSTASSHYNLSLHVCQIIASQKWTIYEKILSILTENLHKILNIFFKLEKQNSTCKIEY